MIPKINVIKGFILNPNEKHVSSILSLISKNEGKCICHNESLDPHCPCTDYRENKNCHCKLYLKIEQNETDKI